MKEVDNTERIQRALDDLVAQKRSAREVALQAAASARAPSLGRRWGALLWCGLGAVALLAVGIVWYAGQGSAQSSPVVVRGEESSVVPVPAVAKATDPATPVQAPRAGTIQHQGKTIVVPATPPNSSASRPAAVVALPPSAVSQAPAPAPAPVKNSLTAADHAKAARDFAYQHFRYKYKVGSASYAVTSQNVIISETVEVPMWNRYRSTGEVGLEYYDNSTFRRTTRRFEVLTEENNGLVKALEITVKL